MKHIYTETKEQLTVNGTYLATIWATVRYRRRSKGQNNLAILLHGGPDGNKDGPDDLLKRLAKGLAEAGISNVRFDFRGQGESGGDYVTTTMSSQREDFEVVYQRALERGYTNVAVAGESFGATCALGTYRQQFKALALLWPAIYLLEKCFAPLLEKENRMQLETQGYIQVGADRVGPRFVEEIVGANNFERQVREVISPTLLIHGDADSEVPWLQSVRAYDILKYPKRLIVVPEGDHCLRRPHEQSVVIKEVVSWFKQYL